MSPSDSPLEITPPRALRWRSLLLVGGVLLLLAGGLYAWRSARTGETAPGQMPPVPVTTIVVTPTEVPAALEAVGSLRAVREVVLAPEVAGRVTAIRFAAGERVGAGQLLVQLFDAPERADRAAARAKADFAGLQLTRSQELAPSGAEPRELLEQRRAEHAQANAAVRQIDARIVQKQLRAPFAGTLGVRQVNLGQYLNPGDAVATLTALDSLYVDFALPQQDFARLQPGATVDVVSDAWPDRRFTARVTAIEPQVGKDTRNIMVQATLPNPGLALRPGMYVTARLALPPIAGALVVPATAIQTSASGDSMTRVKPGKTGRDGIAEVIPVTTGRRFGDKVVVTSGLRPGDIVVINGQLRVQPGAPVTLAPARPAPAKGGR
ncbi:multidrug efflux system membrane fusion protein [Sphingopyxis panaciterrae]|uniref:efflux RND transporter periplasmic adaptor subunit n=1 Tax=Sphingopyxis panaciterrae TaxID=363841 RepID=UPI003132D1E6|nr:multidrug efflux system membrane fusion protein [Sphingopyxis panaciterrae]